MEWFVGAADDADSFQVSVSVLPSVESAAARLVGAAGTSHERVA
jgi:hypothetical protein